jgi:hypothetical protein
VHALEVSRSCLCSTAVSKLHGCPFVRFCESLEMFIALALWLSLLLGGGGSSALLLGGALQAWANGGAGGAPTGNTQYGHAGVGGSTVGGTGGTSGVTGATYGFTTAAVGGSGASLAGGDGVMTTSPITFMCPCLPGHKGNGPTGGSGSTSSSTAGQILGGWRMGAAFRPNSRRGN